MEIEIINNRTDGRRKVNGELVEILGHQFCFTYEKYMRRYNLIELSTGAMACSRFAYNRTKAFQKNLLAEMTQEIENKTLLGLRRSIARYKKSNPDKYPINPKVVIAH